MTESKVPYGGWRAVEARNAVLAERQREVGQVVIAMGEAESFEALMSIVAAPEFESVEAEPEVVLAEAAARRRLEDAAAEFAAEDLGRRLAVEADMVWQERYEVLAGACRRLTLSAGKNAVEFFRALAQVRGLVG